MSKGFGIVQRKIDQLFSGDPEGVFTVEDLCLLVYGRPVSKKQRVAVIRAAKAVAKCHPGIDYWKGETRGAPWVFFHHDNVMSYAIARERGEWRDVHSNQQARKQLDNERDRKRMAPGGAWWLWVQQWIAERDNDQTRLTELAPALEQLEKEQQAWTASIRAMFAAQ